MNAVPAADRADDDAVSAEISRLVAPIIATPGPRIRSDRPIDHSAVWNFCEAVQDANPVYWDEDVARSSRFGRLIAPPQAVMALNMWAWWLPPAARRPSAPTTPSAQARAVLKQFGFDRILYTTRDEEYFEPFGPGDGHVVQQERLQSVSGVKRTGVGRGVFCTTSITFHVEASARAVAVATTVALIHERRERS